MGHGQYSKLNESHGLSPDVKKSLTAWQKKFQKAHGNLIKSPVEMSVIERDIIATRDHTYYNPKTKTFKPRH